MPVRKPVLGYPSKTDAVLALRLKGRSTQEIAKAIGCRIQTVAAFERSAANRRPRDEEDHPGRVLLLREETFVDLQPHATRRRCGVSELARRIVETVVDAGLVDAVLDDNPSEGVAGE